MQFPFNSSYRKATVLAVGKEHLQHGLFGWSPLWLPLCSCVYGLLQIIMWKSATSIQPITPSWILWNQQKMRINTIQFLETCIRISNLSRTRRVIAGSSVYFLSFLRRSKGISCNKMKHILCTYKMWYNAFNWINEHSLLIRSLSKVFPFFTAQKCHLTSSPAPRSLQECDCIWSCQMEMMAVHWR